MKRARPIFGSVVTLSTVIYAGVVQSSCSRVGASISCYPSITIFDYECKAGQPELVLPLM